MVLGSALLCIGTGLLTTLSLDTRVYQWVVCQVILAIGAAGGRLSSSVVIQKFLGVRDVPYGYALVTFFSSMGGYVPSNRPLISTGWSKSENRKPADCE